MMSGLLRRLPVRLRLVLVLLVALLVPVKGTLAASGLLCHDAGGSQPVALAAQADGHHDHAGNHAHHGSDHGAHHAAAPAGSGESPSSPVEGCNLAVLCAVACATPTPPAAPATVPQPLTRPFAPFPALVVAAPRHATTPLDRPPRSV